MRKNHEESIRRNAQLYHGDTKRYLIGDKVWYLCPRKVTAKPGKLTDQWLGPYKIIKRPAEVLYTIDPADYKGPTITVHAAQVFPYRKETIS